MSFLKKLFGNEDKPIKSYKDFWGWFVKNENEFFKVVKFRKNIEDDFFNKITPKLNEIKKGYYFLTGMDDENTVELVFSAEGNVKNIVFVEELVHSAPEINGWKFTALKPALDIKDVNIRMAGYDFNKDNLKFYSNDDPNFPDEIDLTIVHRNLNEENKLTIENGTFIFLDNFLGELKFTTFIDEVEVIGSKDATKELIPIEKLLSFLNWREKEFLEKYEGIRHDTDQDRFSSYEMSRPDGRVKIAIMNTTLLRWDRKASHPWIVVLSIEYISAENNGMPDEHVLKLLNEMEDEIMLELKDSEGYLNVGRQTGDNSREIYFACNDFRLPSKVLHKIQDKYEGKLNMVCDIYKDKYWRLFKHFVLN